MGEVSKEEDNLWGCHPFSGGPPFSIKHPENNFSLQMRRGKGDISVQFKTRTTDWRLPILFGAIMEAELVLGGLRETGGSPKEGYFGLRFSLHGHC